MPGNTVVLTIDSQLQKVAQDSLERKILSMHIQSRKRDHGFENRTRGVLPIERAVEQTGRLGLREHGFFL